MAYWSQYHTRWAAPLAVLMALLAGCGQQPSAGGAGEAPAATSQAPDASGAALRVVATTSIIADMAANVGGDSIALTTLLEPNVDPHSYTPSPEDARAIAESQLILANGVGLEAWLDELIANAGGDRPVVEVAEGLDALPGEEAHAEGEEAHAEGEEAHAEGEEAHAEGDPHMWFDVQHAIHYAEQIRDGLSSVDPTNQAVYAANAETYIAKLRELDAWVLAEVAQVPEERRRLVMNHDTFGYFAARYGFTVVGTVFEGVSSEQEPSAQELAILVERIRDAGVPAIFAENTLNPRLVEQVAAEAGVTVITTLYTDSLGPAGSEGDTYEKMMRHDVTTIVEALK